MLVVSRKIEDRNTCLLLEFSAWMHEFSALSAASFAGSMIRIVVCFCVSLRAVRHAFGICVVTPVATLGNLGNCLSVLYSFELSLNSLSFHL